MLIADDLRKSYGKRPALRGLSFALEPGRVLGFLGPNGAGKTTAIRILTTILEPDKGNFSIDGIGSEQPKLVRRRIGVLPESLGLPKHVTALEYLVFYGGLYGLPTDEAKTSALRLLEDVGLRKRAKSLIGSYSRGMRQRLGIARSLVNDPAVVFLDEPTLGLDPRGQQDLLALVNRIARERDVGVILCSHALSEVETVCDDVVILSLGQVVAKGSVSDVIAQARGNAKRGAGVRIQVPPESTAAAVKRLDGLAFVKAVEVQSDRPGWLRVDLEETQDPGADLRNGNNALSELLAGSVPVMSFETQGGRLGDVFLQLTEGVGG
ncbi:MAG TPA: ABC transporter ATP-binding protein [Acidimicrobiia bacterium]|nr:ABC transporter ATP-binding protein [Acidimicrobiia bacterium]